MARVVHASPNVLSILVPPGLDGGHTAVRVEGAPGETAFIELGAPIATGLHQVDNPVFDRDGNLYVTYSGSRGQQAPVSIFRVSPDGAREPFVSGITNPTSMTFDERGRLYVSSRFEGTVYRIRADGSFEVVAADLGVACGLAFDADGSALRGGSLGDNLSGELDWQHDGGRDAYTKRGRISSCYGTRRWLVCHGAHACVVRRRLSNRSGGEGQHRLFELWPPAGAGL